MAAPFKDMTIAEVCNFVKEAGLPAFRANQILSWIYEKGVSTYDEMTNLPKTVREQLKDLHPLYKPTLLDKQESKDGSVKYLLQYHDGALVETVGLPSDDGRLTVCCSSQSGCAMKCLFCATGKQGLNRNLYPGEIVDQIMHVSHDYAQKVTNVVMMGQGEPFLNYDATIAALEIINDPKLLNIGARHITVSTCGIIEGINKFSLEGRQYTLAVSLHSAIQDKRDRLMPALKKQNLQNLKEALKEYEKETNRRYTFEYALMRGINDSQEDFDALVGYCDGLMCHVNLIPLNEIHGSEFKPVAQSTMAEWRENLEQAGVSATVRRSMGRDIMAACGQLSSSKKAQ